MPGYAYSFLPSQIAYNSQIAHNAADSRHGIHAGQCRIDLFARPGYPSGPTSFSAMDRKRHIMVVATLLGLSCLVQTVVIRRATLPGLDAVRFVGIAQTIDRQGLLPSLRTEGEQPLFPVWVWIVHEAWQHVCGESETAWVNSVQVAAAIPLVLAIVPLYFLLLRLVGSAAALAGSFFFCLLPEVSRLGADGISDSTHLLLFCTAFWAMVEYLASRRVSAGDRRCRSPVWLLLAAAATAMAALARAEVLVLAGALGVTLVLFQFRPGRRQAWRDLGTAAACFLLGLGVVLLPYLAAAGAATPRAAARRVLGWHRVEEESSSAAMADAAATRRLADGEPMAFDAKEPSISLRRRGYPAALVRFGRKLADAMSYWIGALALLGAWRLRRRPASDGDRFVQVFFVLFSLAALRFTAAEGYLAPRHLLGLVVAGIGSAGYGALELASSLRRVPRVARLPVPGAAGAWAIVVLAGVVCLPQTLVRHHHSRLGHREAGRWLATEGEAAGTVLDTQGWTGLYSGRGTRRYIEAPAALGDPELAYLVLEKRELDYDSRRARTLSRLIETAADPAAEFPHPAARKPNQRLVVVYRWFPHRFARRTASRPASLCAGADEDARADPGVRR